MDSSTSGSGQSRRTEKPREFAFISGRANSSREKSKISQSAHRHTARVVNRQRRLLRTQTSPADVENSTTSTRSGLFGDELHASSRSASVPVNTSQSHKHGQVLTFDRNVDESIDRSAEGANASETAPAVNWKAISRPSFNQKEEISEQMLRYLWLSSSSSPTRSLDPALGPMVAGMLQSANFNIGGGRAYALWSSFDWFALYCQEPIVFHGFNVAAAMHDDLLSKKGRWSKSSEIISHRGELLGRVGQLISNIEDSKLELAVFGIATLIVTTLQVGRSWPDWVLLLSPHMPSANFDSVFGRTLVEPEPVKAMMQLVNRIGGLQKIRLPGLAIVAAGVDMRRAGQAGTKPFLPSLSKLHDDISLACIEVQADSKPGYGFSTHIPGGLPQTMLQALTFLCSVDALMSLARDDVQLEYDRNHLVQARNATHHQILSLDRWGDLEEEQRSGCSREAYECCRLTSRLYSTAILWGMPPDTGWHYKIVRQVRDILEASQFHRWPQESARFLAWVLVMCGIASYRSADRRFFEQSLRVTLLRNGVTTLHQLKEVVSPFVWSEKACADGTAVLWDMLDINDTEEDLWDYSQSSWSSSGHSDVTSPFEASSNDMFAFLTPSWETPYLDNERTTTFEEATLDQERTTTFEEATAALKQHKDSTRKAQNRSAQRAYRERQQSRLKEMQSTIEDLTLDRDKLRSQVKDLESDLNRARTDATIRGIKMKRRAAVPEKRRQEGVMEDGVGWMLKHIYGLEEAEDERFAVFEVGGKGGQGS
ncbi:hypothetical protein PRZ48_014974 [Zasmidium cellare]|uniref:BZIP domain-containing protein n=1 Tax=Zasmidium cellare TaxID=395010 RepID=A0ABR0DXA7_ZASCE|nr:hypothetical protein PRZ48_014974 [Zasmidium cellare]